MGRYVIIGKIDRIDEKGDGSAEIIDYKTGKAKKRMGAEEKRQLVIYQIAAEEVFGLKPEKLTFYYLEEGKKASFLASREEKEKEKKEIASRIKKIKKSGFRPSPGWHCRWCDFKNICAGGRS